MREGCCDLRLMTDRILSMHQLGACTLVGGGVTGFRPRQLGLKPSDLNAHVGKVSSEEKHPPSDFGYN